MRLRVESASAVRRSKMLAWLPARATGAAISDRIIRMEG
jgi:hypothetical protein